MTKLVCLCTARTDQKKKKKKRARRWYLCPALCCIIPTGADKIAYCKNGKQQGFIHLIGDRLKIHLL